MSVYIEILAKSEDNKIIKFEGEGVCFAVIGKTEHHIERITDKIHDAQPMTLAHLNMANIDIDWTEKRREVFREAFKVFPQFRTCLSTPDDILDNERALFDVANYSLNEVMSCMFLMRYFCNDHCEGYHNSSFDDLCLNVDRILAFTERGHPWWMGFMAMVCPSLGIDYSTGYDMGGRDASCFGFQRMSPKDFYLVCTGQYPYKFCDKSYHTVLAEDEGYTRNLTKLTGDECLEGNMALRWKELDRLIRNGDCETDLFGNTINNSARVTSVDQLVEVTARWFNETFKEWM